jgi:xanthine dehydrogenase accessory factor
MVEYRVNIEPTPTLLIAGAGHVGAAVAKLAVGLDYRVVVIDDRADLLDVSRLPPPIETVAGEIQSSLHDWPIDANTYVIVVTRGHIHDEQALHGVIDSPAKYVGMIGSRRKIKVIFEDLEDLGVPRSKLDQVHTPIGLNIGAVTVPEIAVSIAAELTQVRRADAVKTVEGPFDLGNAPS